MGRASLGALVLLGACGGEPPSMVAQTAPAAAAREVAGRSDPVGSAEAMFPETAILRAGDVDAAVAAVGNGDEATAEATVDPQALPPELTEVLLTGPGGAPLDALDALDLAMGEAGSDALPLVIGSSSIADEALGDVDLPDPAAAADADLDALP